MTGADQPRRARLARPGELSCLETEGVTGINCACPQGHGGPHRGWYRPAGDDTGEYSLVVVWPVPDQPALVEPDGVDRLLGRIAWAMRSPRRVDELRPLLDEAQAMIRRMRVGMNPHGLELSYVEGERDNLREVATEVEGERDNLREVATEAQRQRDVATQQVTELREMLESDRAAARRLDDDRAQQIRDMRGQLVAIERELHESVRGDGAPESATLADRVAAMRMKMDLMGRSLRIASRFRRRALDRERALKRLVHEHEVGPRLPATMVPIKSICEVLDWPEPPALLFDNADNETEPPSPSASTTLALVREALVDADAMGRGVAPEDVPAVVAGVLEELSRLRAATVDGVPVGTTPETPPDGERAVQCDSLFVSPTGAAAACQLLLDHYGLHIAASGCTWADETMSPENVAAPRPRLDERPSCPVCGEPSPDHEVGECDDTPPRTVGGVRSDPGRAYRPDQTVTVRLDDATLRAVERTIARAARRG